MNTIKSYGLGGVALVIAIFALFFHAHTNVIQSQPKAKGVTNYDTVSLSQGLITTSVNSTSTTASTSQILAQADVQGYSLVSLTTNTSNSGLALYLPASTSISNWLPNPGDRTNFIILNATGTVGISLGIVGNTGSILEVATSSTSSPAVASTSPSKAFRVEVLRKVNTDLLWLVSSFI